MNYSITGAPGASVVRPVNCWINFPAVGGEDMHEAMGTHLARDGPRIP